MFELIFYYFTHIDTGFLQLKIQPAACGLNHAVCCVHTPWTPVSEERERTSAEALTHPTHTQARTRCTRWLLTALCNSRHQKSPSLEPAFSHIFKTHETLCDRDRAHTLRFAMSDFFKPLKNQPDESAYCIHTQFMNHCPFQWSHSQRSSYPALFNFP